MKATALDSKDATVPRSCHGDVILCLFLVCRSKCFMVCFELKYTKIAVLVDFQDLVYANA